MPAPIIYDITRLLTRIVNRTPNGIDRIDIHYARHLLAGELREARGAISTPYGTRLLPRAISLALVEEISHHWGEKKAPGHDGVLRQTFQRLGLPWSEEVSGPDGELARRPESRLARHLAVVRRHGVHLGTGASAAPAGGTYVNVSQFPLWIPGAFSWLERRRDVKGVFFIHDLLPLEVPEYFRPAEYERHRKRMAVLARFAAGAIVTTHVVEGALRAHLEEIGRKDLPILVAPVPVASVFRQRKVPPADDATGSGYFVICGTIEPRKNHLLLLHVWRELVRRMGPAAPKLVVVGTRGWENENVVDLLERCRSLQDHVIEVRGLSTPGLKHLMEGARALLMPSFAEGFGLPVAEALAAGVPVIASDIPVFHEVSGGAIVPVSPIDGEGWLAAIEAFARPGSPERAAAMSRARAREAVDWPHYFAGVEAFLAAL